MRADDRRRNPAVQRSQRSPEGGTSTTPNRMTSSATRKQLSFWRATFSEGVSMRSKEIGTDLQPGLQEHSIFARAQSRAREVWAFAYRPPALLSTTS